MSTASAPGPRASAEIPPAASAVASAVGRAGVAMHRVPSESACCRSPAARVSRPSAQPATSRSVFTVSAPTAPLPASDQSAGVRSAVTSLQRRSGTATRVTGPVPGPAARSGAGGAAAAPGAAVVRASAAARAIAAVRRALIGRPRRAPG